MVGFLVAAVPCSCMGEQPGSGAFPKLAGRTSSYSSRSWGAEWNFHVIRFFQQLEKGSADVLINLADGTGKLKVIRNDPQDCRTGSRYEDCSWPCCAAVPSWVLFLYPLLHEHHVLLGSLRQRICESFVVLVGFFCLFVFNKLLDRNPKSDVI